MPESQDRHTSIIYFHGMGTPRRFEELSRVLDTLDRYTATEDYGKLGMLRGAGLEFERPISGSDPIAYIHFSWFRRDRGRPRRVNQFRLYESYWSPATAGGGSPWAVLLWFVKRMFAPFVVWFSPWRAHIRLKSTYLNRLFHDRGKVPVLAFQRLAKAYRDFEGMGDRRQMPEGVFRQFYNNLSQIYAHDAAARFELQSLAHRWLRSLRHAQLQVLLIAFCAFGFGVGATAIGVYLASIPFSLFTDWTWAEVLNERAGNTPVYLQALSLLAAGLAVFGALRFMRLFLSDVMFWTTTYEKDLNYRKRSEILKSTQDAVMHVISDPLCERVVILGHSLGTAIAYETLLSLGRRETAERNGGVSGPTAYDGLRKISHFITLGSPIDRISYFFQLSFSRYHRYNRIAETLFGSAADRPFADGDALKQHIQWINVRDGSDPVSSRIFSARGPIPNREDILEVEISSSHCPEPAAAHTGYFNSRLGAKVLFDACIRNRMSLQLQEDRPAWSRPAARQLRQLTQGLGAVLSVAFLLGAVGYAIDSPKVMAIAQGASMTLVAAILVLAGLGKFLDRLTRLTLPP